MRVEGEMSFMDVAMMMHEDLKDLLDIMYRVPISGDHNAITFGTIQNAW